MNQHKRNISWLLAAFIYNLGLYYIPNKWKRVQYFLPLKAVDQYIFNMLKTDSFHFKIILIIWDEV